MPPRRAEPIVAAAAVLAPTVVLLTWAVAALVRSPRTLWTAWSSRNRRIGAVMALGFVAASVPTAIATSDVAALGPLGQGALMLAVVAATNAWARGSRVTRGEAANWVAAGLAVLGVLAVADAAGVLPALFDRPTFAGRAALWQAHPNVLGAAVVVPLVLVSAWGRRAAVAWAHGGAALVVVASGSRTVLWALVAVQAVAWTVRHGRAVGRTRGALAWRGFAWGFLVLALTVVIASTTTVFDRFDPRRALGEAEGVNILYASEDLSVGAWSTLGVTIRRIAPPPPLRGDRTWAVTKTASPGWSRIQQGVTVPAGGFVSFQVDLRTSDADAWIGLHSRTERAGAVTQYALRRGPAGWSVVGVEGLRVVTWSAEERDGWWTLRLVLENPNAEPMSTALGITPDQRTDEGASAVQVRRPQAVLGPPAAYAPTFARSVDGRASLGTLEDRRAWVAAALAGFVERPLFGQGVGRFAAYVTSRDAGARPGAEGHHPHNLVAQALFERGIAGLVGLAIVFAAIVGWHRGSGSPAGWYLVVSLLLVNTLDTTFWTAPVSYAVAASCGLAALRPGAPRKDAAG